MSRKLLRATAYNDIPRAHRILLSALAEKSNIPEKVFFLTYLKTKESQIRGFIASIQQVLSELESGEIVPNGPGVRAVNPFPIGNLSAKVDQCLKN